MKIVAAISRFINPPEAPTPVAPAPFDDGLVEIARLIEADDPVTDAGPADLPSS